MSVLRDAAGYMLKLYEFQSLLPVLCASPLALSYSPFPICTLPYLYLFFDPLSSFLLFGDGDIHTCLGLTILRSKYTDTTSNTISNHRYLHSFILYLFLFFKLCYIGWRDSDIFI